MTHRDHMFGVEGHALRCSHCGCGRDWPLAKQQCPNLGAWKQEQEREEKRRAAKEKTCKT